MIKMNRIKNNNSVELSFNVLGALADLKSKVMCHRLLCQVLAMSLRSFSAGSGIVHVVLEDYFNH